MANVVADVGIETDRNVGLAIDPSVVVALPSVTMFVPAGLKAKALFASVASAELVDAFELTVPAVVWNPSNTARVTGFVPFELSVVWADMPVGVDIVTKALTEYAARI